MSPPSRACKIQARIDQFLQDRGSPRAGLEHFRDLMRLEGEEFVGEACALVSNRPPNPEHIQKLASYLSMGASREFLLWFIATSEPGRADGSNPAWLAVLTDDILYSLTVSDLLFRSGPLFLELCYRRLLGRPVDGAGAAGWSGLLEQGCRREFILWKLLRSEEAQARGNGPAGALALDVWTWTHANATEILLLDGQDFLELAYRRLLGRRPDAAGAAYWAELAKRGASKPLILWTMLRCPEALARQCPSQGMEALEAWASTQLTVPEILLVDGPQFLELCYRRLLGRAPEPQGLAHWRELKERGGSKEFILWTMLRCPEAQARRSCPPQGAEILERWANASISEIFLAGDADFLELCFRRLRGQSATPQDIASWLALMESGCTKEEILWMFCCGAQAATGRKRPLMPRMLTAAVRSRARFRRVLGTGWRQRFPGRAHFAGFGRLVERGLRRGKQVLEALATRRAASAAERKNA